MISGLFHCFSCANFIQNPCKNKNSGQESCCLRFFKTLIPEYKYTQRAWERWTDLWVRNPTTRLNSQRELWEFCGRNVVRGRFRQSKSSLTEIQTVNTHLCNYKKESRFSAANEKPYWLRGRDLNPRPLGYEPNELPDCSTPRSYAKGILRTCQVGVVKDLRSQVFHLA